MNFSPYQIDIFKAVQTTQNHICVEATAGAGKTSTILEALKLIPRMKKSIFLSFSNTIVNELKSRVPDYVKASTLHSLGCRMIMKQYRGVKIDNDKWFKILVNDLKAEDKNKANFRICGQTSDVINYARMTLTRPSVIDLSTMCDHYGLEWTTEIIYKAMKFLNEQEKHLKMIDFTDMIYLPATSTRLIDEQFDFVFLDEAQDLNNAQRTFIEKILRPNGRLVAVGDSKQSIYSFSGSSIDSFDKLKQRPNTTELPLSISYRCAKNIVIEAQKIFDTIQPFEGAIDGIVRKGDLEEAKAGDMVLCRKTAPLILAFFYLLRKGIKSTVIGKDIEVGLLDLAAKVQTTDKERTLLRIEDQKEVLREELIKLKFHNPLVHPRYLALLDKVEVLHLIIHQSNDPGNLSATIRELFREDKKAIRLMTIHRSKGLENDRVFIIDKFNGTKTIPSPFATKDWEKVQEKNLLFVAITRAKKELIYINLDE